MRYRMYTTKQTTFNDVETSCSIILSPDTSRDQSGNGLRGPYNETQITWTVNYENVFV